MAALEHLLPLDIEVTALDLSGGKDPDEILNSEGPEGLAERVKHTLPLDEIIFRHLQNTVDLTSPFGIDQAVKTCEHYFSMLTSRVVQARYWEQAAQRLGLPPEILYSELRRLQSRNAYEQQRRNTYAEERQKLLKNNKPTSAGQQLGRGAEAALSTLLELALVDENCARNIAMEAPSAILNMSNTGKAVNFITALVFNEEWNELQKKIGQMPAEISDDENVAKILAAECHYDPEKRRQVCEDCLSRLNEEAVKQRKKELLAKMKAAAGTPEELEIFKELSSLQK